MGIPYAEVIGDPIAHSKSPLIHKHWLARLGLEGDYRATRVAPEDLPAFIARRRADPDWRGCNVTIPHKERILPLLDAIEPGAAEIGAVNCVAPQGGALTATNTDIDGVAAALSGASLEGRKVALIGAGGGARAALRYLLSQRPPRIAILVRNPAKAAHFAGGAVEVLPLDRCEDGLASVAAIVNASPMGMAGCPEMPDPLLAAVTRNAPGTVLFDMVYKPLETRFLAAGAAAGGVPVDGLTMLIGQARAAFERFFGRPPPPDDGSLRHLLTT
jgi:shikimate dehydrogenase